MILVCMARALPEARVSPLADDAVIKRVPLQRFPRDLFMVARTVTLLRGLCHALDLDIQVGVDLLCAYLQIICFMLLVK